MLPLQLLLTLGPLALYCLVLGSRLLSRRPVVMSVARARGALFVGVSGFVIFGPMSWLLPEIAFQRFGMLTWVMLIALYALLAVQFTAYVRPGIVLWNAAPDEAMADVREALSSMDAKITWAGGAAALPERKMELRVVSEPKSITLLATTDGQSARDWLELESRLGERLSNRAATLSLPAALYLLAGVVGLAFCLGAARFPDQIAPAFFELMRMGRY